MKRMRSRSGQGIAEYAVLLAIVIGAAIAVQQYLKSLMQGFDKGAMDKYSNQAQLLGGYGGGWEPTNRTSDSFSKTNLAMTNAKAGTANIDSHSNATLTK